MKNNSRYIELDLLRAVAILGMIVYHTSYDLQMFYGWHIDVFSGGWKLFQVAVASLFLLLVGVTSSFSNRNILKRFLRIGGAALLVTIATYIIDPQTYVRFGVLHLIAVSALLIPMIGWLRAWLIIPGILLLIVGPFVGSIATHSHLLLPLGMTYAGFATVDYFPLIPWFGVILIGYGVGYLFYGTKSRVPSHEFREKILIHIRNSKLLVLVTFLGRHSLMLYLIHQPIIIGLLWMILGRPNF